MIRAQRRMRSRSATEEPPNFITIFIVGVSYLAGVFCQTENGHLVECPHGASCQAVADQRV
jgi:hypothetical protein